MKKPMHYLDRAYCSLSVADGTGRGCCNTSCDRYVSRHVIAGAEKAKLPLGLADMRTSKCGFISDGDEPREAA